MPREYLNSEEFDKIVIPIYVICDFARDPDRLNRPHQANAEYRFLLRVPEDENFAGFKGMIYNKTQNPQFFLEPVQPQDQRFIHNGFYVSTPAKFRDILQKHLQTKIEPHLEKRFEEYIPLSIPKPVDMTDSEWEEKMFEHKRDFLYEGVEAMNIFLTTRRKISEIPSERNRSLMDFSLVKRKFILCNALYQNVEECYKKFNDPEDAKWESQNRNFINPEDLLSDLDFKHNYFDWSDGKEPTVIQFGELIERVAENFQHIADMIRDACAELEKIAVPEGQDIRDPGQETNVKRRKFKIQLMMDGMRYMATLNQNLANFIVPLHEKPEVNRPRMLKYRDM